MFIDYDDYLESGKPMYRHQCPKCRTEFWSNDGWAWESDGGAVYNIQPFKDGTCVECETEAALHDPDHYGAQEVLIQARALEWLVHDLMNIEGEGERLNRMIQIYNALKGVEGFRESAEYYLEEHETDVEAAVEDKF